MSSRMTMSQANACELKAALGHVLVSPIPNNWQHDNADELRPMAERCPMTFPAQVHPSCSWRALAAPATTGRHRAPPFPLFRVGSFDHPGGGPSGGQPPCKAEQRAPDTRRVIGRPELA